MQAVLLGGASFAAARVIGARRGLAPALAFLGLVLGLGGDYLASAATEPLALTLACASLAVLWAPAARGRLLPALVGLWLLDLALQARPGAQFLLPCLGLWIVWTCRGRWLHAAAGVALVALSGTLVSGALNRLYGTSDSSTSSAAAYPFYGLATGSNYKQMQEDLGAELQQLPDDRARTRLIFERLAAPPRGTGHRVRDARPQPAEVRGQDAAGPLRRREPAGARALGLGAGRDRRRRCSRATAGSDACCWVSRCWRWRAISGARRPASGCSGWPRSWVSSSRRRSSTATRACAAWRRRSR